MNLNCRTQNLGGCRLLLAVDKKTGVVSDDQALCLSIQSDLGAIVVDTFIQQNSRNKNMIPILGLNQLVS